MITLVDRTHSIVLQSQPVTVSLLFYVRTEHAPLLEIIVQQPLPNVTQVTLSDVKTKNVTLIDLSAYNYKDALKVSIDVMTDLACQVLVAALLRPVLLT